MYMYKRNNTFGTSTFFHAFADWIDNYDTYPIYQDIQDILFSENEKKMTSHICLSKNDELRYYKVLQVWA